MTISMEHPLSKELPVDEYLLESTDPRWNEPATLHSVRISAVNLNNRIDWVYFALDSKINRLFTELDHKMDRRFSELDTKIEIRFKSVERNARVNYVLSGIIAMCSVIGAIGVFIR